MTLMRWNVETSERLAWLEERSFPPNLTMRAPNDAAPGSPEWWRDLLYWRLGERVPALLLYDSYYAGAHALSFATSKFRETFGNLFAAFADNWCDLIVDSVVERLRVDGFRIGTNDPVAEGDEAAWQIWQANGMDAESNMAHLESVKLGSAYVLAGPGLSATDPALQVLSAYEAIVATDPAQPRDRLAALRTWRDEVGTERATLYLPDRIYWWARSKDSEPWEPDLGSGRNPLRTVQVVPLANTPSLRHRQGRSEIDRVIPLQDAVNKLVADMIVASEYAAFRQRWATGVEIPNDPTTGLPMTDQYLSAVSRMFTVPAPDAKFGDFEVTDLSNYVNAVEMLIQHVAAQTRTPPHYLLGQSGAFPSGESLKATETGLVAKVRRKQLVLGEAWEDAMRLAFLVAGDTARATDPQCEVIWRDPESVSEAERVDALVKMATLGVPHPVLWERWGASPQEVQRWLEAAARDATSPAAPPAIATAPATGAPTPPATGGTPGVTPTT